MGKHSSANTATGVLATVRQRPVLAAFIVPAAATLAIVGSSLAIEPGAATQPAAQVVAESPVVIDESASAKPTDAALEKAKAQAKEKAPKATMSVKTEQTQDSQSPSRSSADDAPSKSGDSAGETGTCKASYYWEPQPTASGEQFDPNALTAAHKTLPLGSKVEVTNKANGKKVTVRINDRGPYVSGRCLDLSKASMEAVGGTGAGVITASYRVL